MRIATIREAPYSAAMSAMTSTASTPELSAPDASLAPLQALCADDMQQVNEVIISSVDIASVPLITHISQHIVRSGGKRLRPTLTVACAKLLHYDGRRHLSLAAAVELIHTATLLHDDVVDESTMRRGMQTANNVWSNQSSVLVGDFLLSRAFQLMVGDGSLEVLELLSNASATISQGEVQQLMAVGDLDTTRETYLEIIRAKTATLFSAACEIAPIISGRGDLRAAFRGFGEALGIAFQLVDDALDYSAKEAELGKAVGDDLREGKLTLPVIEAYQHGDVSERAFWQRVIAERDYRDGDTQHAIEILQRHEAIKTTLALAEQYIELAHGELVQIGGEPTAHTALEACLRFCTARVY